MARRQQQQTQIAQATIDGMSHDGRGISKINDKITFIEGALPGEEVLFSYHKRKSTFDEGKVITILKPASNRVEPRCPHANICGGCSLQHLEPTNQIYIKQQVLLEQLQHFGHISPKTILAPLVGPKWGYRRKARLGVKYVAKKGGILVGFREKAGRYLADLQSCDVLHPTIGNLFNELKQLIMKLSIFQQIPQIEVAIGDDKTALIFRHLDKFSKEDIKHLESFGEQHQIQIYLQPHGPDSIHLLWPKKALERLSYHLPNHQIELLFHPSDFMQINADINRSMVDLAIKYLEPTKQDRILDLFCGLGNFTLAIAKNCKSAIGVEGNNMMVLRAKENSSHNQIENAEFYCADLTSDFSNAPWANQQFDKILLDPPRSGALEVIKHFPKLGPIEKIVYISCNPATLARDAGELVNQQGYQLVSAGVMDMFPHTTHVESIAVFCKVG